MNPVDSGSLKHLDGAEQRVADTLEASEHAAEWEKLKRRHPRPALPSLFSTAKPDLRSSASQSATRMTPAPDWLAGDPERTVAPRRRLEELEDFLADSDDRRGERPVKMALGPATA